ncbi:MAG: PEGA domain-containing protein [Lentisphaeria bacterium]|nr:PEGA domain-containing protein [Lentisphaeria bacterium]
MRYMATAGFLSLGMISLCIIAAETTTEITTSTTTSTVITRTLVKEKVKWSPFRVCVLDFTSLDIEGQKRFLDQSNNPINIPPQCTLNNADRLSVNRVMQGFVRLIDAWSNKKTADANRFAQVDDNRFNRTKALELYHTVVKGTPRPMVIGAEYLAAYLGRRNDVFTCLDSGLVTAAMNRLQSAPDFPKDFMLRLARETGATHLIYGTVSDLRTRTNSFKGYGIQTKTTIYQLDVIVKMVDLIQQSTVYSNVYTGSYREQRPVSTTQIDHNIFQNLMTSALEQAAEDLYDKCKPGRKNQIAVTPMPYWVTVNPSGGMFFKPASADIRVNGEFAGSGGSPFLLPAGKYRLEIKAPGYKTKQLDIRVSRDEVISVQLEK